MNKKRPHVCKLLYADFTSSPIIWVCEICGKWQEYIEASISAKETNNQFIKIK